MIENGKVLIISGFSGVGKGTIVKNLINKNKKYKLSISATTRKPRIDEVHGREYFFISDDEFDKLIKEDKLLEYTKYIDNYYGTPKNYIKENINAGYNLILEIEIEGALNVKEKANEVILIFILPPSIEELIKRLNNRKSETDETIRARINKAKEEIKNIYKYDYVVVNDDIEKSVEIIENIDKYDQYKTSNMIDIINKIKTELLEYKGDYNA